MYQGFTSAQATTYAFVVRLDWVIQRNNNSFVAADYQKWAEALYKNFEVKLEN